MFGYKLIEGKKKGFEMIDNLLSKYKRNKGFEGRNLKGKHE